MDRSFNPRTDLSLLPEEPGVYVMKDAEGRVLYVGKATSLRSRVRSYFGGSDPRAFVARLEGEVDRLEVVVTPTPRDALILEKTLVRQLQPRYNVDLRDDRSHSWVRIDLRHPFPRLERVRRRARDGAAYAGPYVSGAALRSYLGFLSRTLRLRICADRVFANRTRPCLQHQMGRCMAPCVLPGLEEAYREAMALARTLLRREDGEVAARIEALMRASAADQRYEDAARYRDLLRSLAGLWDLPEAVGPHAFHGDVFGGHESDGGLVLQVVHVREGRISGTWQQVKPGPHPPLEEALPSFILQFYDLHRPPREVLAPLDPGTCALLEEVLSTGPRVQVGPAARGPRRAFLDMARRNAEVAWERWQMGRNRADAAMDQLRAALGLPKDLRRIECFDISSFQARDAVGAMSVAVDGELRAAEYRVWHPRQPAADDIAVLREVLARRLARIPDGEDPRLLLLDGGRAHLAQALPLIQGRAGAHLHLAAIAKARPAEGLAEDRVYRSGSRVPVALRADSPAFLLLARLRDEAHRFGVKHHRGRRRARTLGSILLEVPGIGPNRRAALLRAFGSVAALREASAAELRARGGLPRTVAEALAQYLRED
ncbi:MAG: excinuclease ABC subunit UvrC [Deltaproteobacteria bacterium]|nr:excinuclease ABC subunit UvrC [Deltaproteobacteria bacterium]